MKSQPSERVPFALLQRGGVQSLPANHDAERSGNLAGAEISTSLKLSRLLRISVSTGAYGNTEHIS